MIGLSICIICLLFCPLVSANEVDEPKVQSTQEIEIEQNIDKFRPSFQEKNEQIRSRRRYNKYLKTKEKIKKLDFKRSIKEKELEYLEYRLEEKKNKLEKTFPDKVKGEE